MIRRPPRSTQGVSSAASDVYKRQVSTQSTWETKMLGTLMRKAILPLAWGPWTRRGYFPERQLMKARKGKYFIDPNLAAERIVRLFAIHDNTKNPSQITLESRFEDIGLSSLDLVELCLAVEDEFNIEFTDEQCESFKRVNDIVECTTTNQWVDM
eukprot:TRINITY_DN16016_c0_g1_i1.p1 TRINITY_DN16016_c0_g1~~TRINITY_DN16016_c0_g1_i1.p1  ORF type:complete len:155 (-),score=33.19 TRINITY_DN16016_c0_g1_i1:57-521(-)